MLLHNRLAGGDDVLGLVAEEAGGLDVVFQFLGLGIGEGVGVGIAGKQGGGDHVDTHISALGGEDGRNQQLQGILVIEFAMSVGIELGQAIQDGADALFLGVGEFHFLSSV